MKQIDKIKRQRFETEMKIINLEERQKRHKLTKNEEKELEFLNKKKAEFDNRIESLT
jgi:hypothetical protein